MAVYEDYFEATFLFKNVFSPRVCTTALGFLYAGVTPPSASDAAEELYTIFSDDDCIFETSGIIDDWTKLGCHVAFGTPTGDILGEHNVSVTGTLTDVTITSNCALLVNKSTASGGRANRGRMYLPPLHLNEGAVDAAGNISSSPLAGIQLRLNATLAALAVADWQPVLFHQGVSPAAPTNVTALTAQSLIATQRRRMRG